MSNDKAVETHPKSANELAEDRTDMAFQRTRLAADRTLMAWIRTSLSMISFGFTIFKFFQYLHESDPVELARGTHGARNLGMLMT
jgi:putative membrane protein